MSPSDLFDLEKLRLPVGNLATSTAPVRPQKPRHRQGELFLKGPVPWNWLQVASQLPGKALAVGLTVWHLAGLQSKNTVRLAPSKTRSLGLSPRVARRGLRALEDAGLVSVGRHPGRSPDVSLQKASEPERSQAA
jgi:DNA-binding transcriptional ArsR family regulator